MAIILRIRFSTEIKDLKLDITNTNVQVITPAWIRNIIRESLKQRDVKDVDVPIKLIRMGKVLRGKIYGNFIREVQHAQRESSLDKQFYLNAMMGRTLYPMKTKRRTISFTKLGWSGFSTCHEYETKKQAERSTRQGSALPMEVS